MQYIPVELTVKLATICVAAYEWWVRAMTKLYDIFVACCGVFQDREYILFEEQSHCYNVLHVSPWATGSATPKWHYNAEKKLFTEWGDEISNKKHTLPYLSLEIVHGTRVQYDLTEFIEGVRVRTQTDTKVYPSLPELLAVWTTSSGIVLHPTRFIARVITEEGDTEEFTLDGKRWVPDAPREDAVTDSKDD
jgi:hypothetical protein